MRNYFFDSATGDVTFGKSYGEFSYNGRPVVTVRRTTPGKHYAMRVGKPSTELLFMDYELMSDHVLVTIGEALAVPGGRKRGNIDVTFEQLAPGEVKSYAIRVGRSPKATKTVLHAEPVGKTKPARSVRAVEVLQEQPVISFSRIIVEPKVFHKTVLIDADQFSGTRLKAEKKAGQIDVDYTKIAVE